MQGTTGTSAPQPATSRRRARIGRLSSEQREWSCEQLVQGAGDDNAADAGSRLPAMQLVGHAVCASGALLLQQIGVQLAAEQTLASAREQIAQLGQCVAAAAKSCLTEAQLGWEHVVTARVYSTPGAGEISLGAQLSAAAHVPVLSIRASCGQPCALLLELLSRRL